MAPTLVAPDVFKRYAGQSVFFRVHLTPDGATLLRPIAAPASTSPSATPSGQVLTQLSGTPATVLQQLMSPESLRAMPTPLATALAGLGVILSPAMSTEAQVARVRELLGRSGVLQLAPAADGGAREATFPSILLRLLGFGTDQVTKERARGMLGEIDNRQERAVTALRSDVINADILAWVNGAPVELNLQRGARGNPRGNPSWIINFYTQFSKDSDVWLRVEHLPVSTVRLDAWLTDPGVFLNTILAQSWLRLRIWAQAGALCCFQPRSRHHHRPPLFKHCQSSLGRSPGLVGMRDLDEIKAIALEYGKREAPSILAKGEGEDAMSIIDAAFDLGLPVIEDEMLQRLLSGVDIGEEIPESLYRAVAVVLAWVFWLRGDEPGR